MIILIRTLMPKGPMPGKWQIIESEQLHATSAGGSLEEEKKKKVV